MLLYTRGIAKLTLTPPHATPPCPLPRSLHIGFIHKSDFLDEQDIEAPYTLHTF